MSYIELQNVHVDETGITVNVLKIRTPVSDKMTYANSVDPDQTAPKGAV